MNKFHEALHKLTEKDETRNNFKEQLEINIQSAINILKINIKQDNFVDKQHSCNDNISCRFISLSFYILHSIKTDESVLSINYINDVKKLFQFIISLGILPNLIAGVGISLNKRITNFDKIPVDNISVQEQYYRLSVTVKGLLLCLKINSLRNFILTYHFNDVLAALLQLCYAPIKKPNESYSVANEFVMTTDFYQEVMIEREYFQQELQKILFQSYSPQVIHELMFFYGNSSSPKWLKFIVYKILIQKLQLGDGVESFIKAVLDSESVDTGSRWKQYDIIVKILMTKPTFVDNKYYENICTQILKLLDKKDRNGEICDQFLQIISSCIKYLYEKDKTNCNKYFLNTIIYKLTQYSNKYDNKIEYGVKTNEFMEIILLWNKCFVVTSVTLQSLPHTVLSPIIAILFNFFIILQKSSYDRIVENLNNILIKYISNCEINKEKYMFDTFLFGKEIDEFLSLKNNIEIVLNVEGGIEIKKSNVNIRINSLIRSDTLLNLMKNKEVKNKIASLCIYLLNASMSTDLSITKSNTDLLNVEVESQVFMNESTERKLACYNLLSNLIEDPNVHTVLQKQPETILNFITNMLKIYIENNLHKSIPDSEQFQNLFLLIMILKIITENTQTINNDTRKFLTTIYNETSNDELKILISSIWDLNSHQTELQDNEEFSEYKRAVEDMCDPLLPVRGHALMSLARLIEEKDPEACANKQYILNISQQHIKHEDSYIYLNAIKVLAALGDCFPDTILNILTEEYSAGSKELFEKNSEIRMKLGEVLIRVVKSLGEIAPKYKSILLNTFLSGVKDEDHLMRASSLSNLGEICRILGYKLGSVVTEVLSCIHAVIATDKAVEARRAAVSVIRYLFVGLEKETIIVLKDEILPIYRTLKVVYSSDSDDITRLQAQLALEELNANVRDYLFPSITFEKKIVI